MKKLLMTLAAFLIPLCWIQSQDITIDGTITADNSVIETVTSDETIVIDAGLLPLWYTTILQLEQSQVIIDSLRLAYDNARKSAKYYSLQAGNLTKQKKELQRTIQLMQEKYELSDGNLNESGYQLKKWKTIGRVSTVAAFIFGFFAVAT